MDIQLDMYQTLAIAVVVLIEGGNVCLRYNLG